MGSALFFGSVFDAAQGVLLMEKDIKKAHGVFEKLWKSQKINGKTEKLSTTDKVKWSKADMDEFILTDEDKALIEKGDVTPQWVSMRRKGHLMLDAYNEQVVPHLKEVISTQQYVKIENEDGDLIRGYTDLIAVWELNEEVANSIEDEKLRESILELKKYNGQVIIFDNKTASQKYKEDSVKDSRQLGTYVENPLLDFEVELAGYIVVPKKFRKQKLPKIPIQIIIDKVDSDVVEEIFEEYEDSLKGIKLGDFPCTRECTKTPWGCCYAKYCSSGGEDTTGLVYVGKDNTNGKKSS
ncbi:MAG: hypothetical protein COB41_00610 [Proteobacteria bacterium]|nr:MAG: hypothetical protein COB41_00610 [Pseudomonadota bacterium]